jgi:hypothetical protein
VNEQFLHPDHRRWLLSDADPASLLGRMRAFVPPVTAKWLDLGEE